MSERYRVGIGSDLVSADGTSVIDEAVAELLVPVPGLAAEPFGVPRAELAPEDVRDFDAVVTLWQRFTPATFEGVERLATIARWGVGYDMIDVDACTENDILLSITRDAVRRPVAEAIVTLVLALAKGVVRADRHMRSGGWREAEAPTRLGLRGKVLGTIGIGNIGAELVELLRPFGLARILAADPYVSTATCAELGIELAELDTLLAESDVVCVNCPLTPETEGLVGERALRRMKPTAVLVNTARGPIVDEDALVTALREGWIAGAALDVFAEEPLSPGSPLRELENVVLSPHAIALTDELFALNGRDACENVLAVLRGEAPRHVVNREVLDRPRFRAKLARLGERWNETTGKERHG